MKTEMKMPDLSTASNTVKVLKWLVEPGQAVKQGQPILEVETDKAAMEVEAYTSGTLCEILAYPDTDVEVGQVIGIIEVVGESATPAKPASDVKPEPAQAGASAPGSSPIKAAPGGMFARNRQKAAQAAQSPEVTPSPAPLTPASSAPQWTTAQRVVAQRMQESKQNIPHFYLQTSANAEGMVACRTAAAGEKPVWDAFFVSAVGKALKSFNRMCTSLANGQLVAQSVDAVGVAVDLDNELYVIQIVNPATKSVEHLSAEIRTLVQRLRDGDPEAKKVRPGNITISNLGATGVESFTAIVNPPEAAILAVGKVAPQVVAINGQVAIQNRVALTLSVDHRIVNGRYAADFLAKVVAELEAIGDHPV